MLARYSHIRMEAKRKALQVIVVELKPEPIQKPATEDRATEADTIQSVFRWDRLQKWIQSRPESLGSDSLRLEVIGKSLAPQDQHRSEHANGESEWRGFLRGVNQADDSNLRSDPMASRDPF